MTHLDRVVGGDNTKQKRKMQKRTAENTQKKMQKRGIRNWLVSLVCIVLFGERGEWVRCAHAFDISYRQSIGLYRTGRLFSFRRPFGVPYNSKLLLVFFCVKTDRTDRFGRQSGS